MDSAREQDWLSIVRRATGVAALVVGVGRVVSWAFQFAMTEAVIAAVGGADGWMVIMTTLWVVQVAASAVVLAGLIAGWRLAQPVWARGVTPVALGMVVLWGWWLLNRTVDVWGWDRLTPEQIERLTEDSSLLFLSYASTFTSLAIDLLAVALVMVGGLRLLSGGAVPAAVEAVR